MGTMTTQELARLLNDPLNVGINLSASIKLYEAIRNRDVKRVRNYLSAFGKSKFGFSSLDSDQLQIAFQIMQDAGYRPCGEFKTENFHIVKVNP